MTSYSSWEKADALRKTIMITTLKTKVEHFLHKNKNTSLSLTPTQSFPTLQGLAIYIRAAADQHKLPTLTPRCRSNDLQLTCPFGLIDDCPAFWQLGQIEDGTWKLLEFALEHTDHKRKVGLTRSKEEIALRRKNNLEIDFIENSPKVKRQEAKFKQGLGIKKRTDLSIDYNENTKKVQPTESRVRKVSSSYLDFRTVADIMDDVHSLIASGPLEMPSIENRMSFRDHNDFRIHCLAVARQSGFSVWTLSQGSVGSLEHFMTKCYRNHARLPIDERCTFQMVVRLKKFSDGSKRWTVDSEKPHSRVCFKFRASSLNTFAPTSNESGPTASTSRLQYSPPSQSPRPITNYKPLPLSSSSQVLPSHKRERPPTTSSTNAQKYRKISSVPTPSRALSVEEVSDFLQAISQSLSRHGAFLHSLGVNSTQAIVNLISMNSLGLEYFFEFLEKNGTIKLLQRDLFLKELKEMKRELRFSSRRQSE